MQGGDNGLAGDFHPIAILIQLVPDLHGPESEFKEATYLKVA